MKYLPYLVLLLIIGCAGRQPPTHVVASISVGDSVRVFPGSGTFPDVHYGTVTKVLTKDGHITGIQYEEYGHTINAITPEWEWERIDR